MLLTHFLNVVPCMEAFSDLNLVYISSDFNYGLPTLQKGCRAYSNVTNNMSSSPGNVENLILKCDNVGENLILKREYVSREFRDSFSLSMRWCCEEGRTVNELMLRRGQNRDWFLSQWVQGACSKIYIQDCSTHCGQKNVKFTLIGKDLDALCCDSIWCSKGPPLPTEHHAQFSSVHWEVGWDTNSSMCMCSRNNNRKK